MKLKKYITTISIVIFLTFIILISQSKIGVLKDNIEKDARKAHKIPEEWITAKDVNNNLGSLLFYSEDLSNFTFSIYQNKPGLSFGYFFRLGGGLPEISEEILIESTKPFAVIISENSGEIKFYNIDGHPIPYDLVIERTL